MVTRKICVAAVVVLIGIELLIGSILLFVYGGGLVESNVKKECELHVGTKIYDNWRNPPLPFKISFYFFNITDDEFLNGTKVPIVEQVGPFVYQETRTKEDVLAYDNGTISYRETRSYMFDRSLSVGPESTEITTLNIVYMTFVNAFQTTNIPDDIKEFLREMLQALSAQPVMTRSVKELLWGYDDEVLYNISQFRPDMIPSIVVSILNASVGDAGLNTFLINSGIDVHQNESDRIKKAGNIERYNGETSLPYWTNEYANMINGTDSTIWHEGATKDDQVYIFSPDVCRSLHLQYAETNDNAFDIEILRFTTPTDVFANTSKNEGFCLNTTNAFKNTTEIECLPTGLMSLRSCLKPSGSSEMPIPLPIIASSPHFFDAADSVRDAVQGLQPNPTIHRSFMDIEPITGTVMNGSRRMQININVLNNSEMELIAHLKPFVFPLMWLDEHAEIDEKNANDFRSSVLAPISLINNIKYALLGCGILLLVITAVLVLFTCVKNNRRDGLNLLDS